MIQEVAVGVTTIVRDISHGSMMAARGWSHRGGVGRPTGLVCPTFGDCHSLQQASTYIHRLLDLPYPRARQQN